VFDFTRIHSASYTFAAWGLFHGIFLILERTKFGKYIHILPHFFRHLYVLFVVIFSWVLFRAENFQEAAVFFKVMFTTLNGDISALGEYINPIVITAFSLGIILSLGLNSYLRDYLIVTKNKFWLLIYQCFSAVSAISVLFITLLPLSSNSYSPFLYFRF